MHLLKIFQSQSRFFYTALLGLGIINSFTFSVLLLFINLTIAGKPFPIWPQYGWLIFFGLLAVSVVTTKVFQTYLVKLTQQILYGFELNIVDQLRSASLSDFQKLGSERVYTAINDVRVLGLVPEVMIVIVNSSIIVVCALAYLCYTSVAGGLCMLGLMLGMLIFYSTRNKAIRKNLGKVRDLQDKYHKYLLDLLNGFKEVKMSSVRNRNLFTLFIKANRDNAKALGQQTAVRYLDNELIGRYSWYFALGMVIFVLPALFNMRVQDYIPFIIVVLYLMGPLSSLVGIMTHLNNINIAVERIQSVEKEISTVSVSDSKPAVLPCKCPRFESLRFKNICFEYTDHLKQKSFTVGPISLNINKGEIIFVTGGNGSGKSTFMNLLTGLYQASAGSISYNGHPVPLAEYNAYSDCFSAIFTNSYLFSENYDGFDLRTENTELMHYINMMQLKHVLIIDNDTKKIDIGLSKGQTKRLALIYALMENRELLVLDEWAAEQDPVFRTYFYEFVLADLKSMGKTIIAVTHDDHYFHHADRIIKFDYGTIVNDQTISKVSKVAELDQLFV
ncbi:cyclic peptide export ABC transporter [Spirosoma utsteinense]|nr:cyclic peptide export ABC transporter [Spirosoma utsteinense]MBC3787166.1 cyclic peptide transporter [Spirosoma utsteinense]